MSEFSDRLQRIRDDSNQTKASMIPTLHHSLPQLHKDRDWLLELVDLYQAQQRQIVVDKG